MTYEIRNTQYVPMPFPHLTDPVPWLNTDQMIEVDRAMVEDFGIELMQMMENAGRCLATLARVRFLDGDARGKRVTVLAGTGGNGGGALVCARRLHGWGARVEVYVTRPDAQFRGVPAHQLAILRRMSLPVGLPDALNWAAAPDLVIDGVISYSLRGAPAGPAAMLIRWANDRSRATLALDAPSGLDTTTGTVHDPTIRAAATLTLALPKEGLRAPQAGAVVGELYLADISVPPELYSRPPLNLTVGPIFAAGDIVRLR